MTPEPTVEQPSALHRSARYRAHPSPAQRQVLRRQMAACRWVFNAVLEIHFRAQQRGVDPPETRTLERRLVTELRGRRRGRHLRPASSAALRFAVREADAAARRWRYTGGDRPHWRRAGTPGSMHYYPSAVHPTAGVVIRGEGRRARVQIPRLGLVRAHLHRDLPGRPVRLTIREDDGGRWWIAVVCDVEVQHEEATGRIAAVDLGAGRTLAWVVWIDTATGEHGRYSIPAAEIDHRHEQQRLNEIAARRARCVPASRRHTQLSQRLARRRASLANRRREAARLMAKRILDDVDLVVVETLALKGLIDAGGPDGARLLSAGMAAALAELRAVAERRGKKVVAAHRYLASTHLCAVCDRRADPMPLSMRTWTCGRCGTRLHRDYGAATTLLRHSGRAGMPPVDVRTRLALAGA
ncbi:MAG: transposase [Nocardioides sp.]|nr:transposase [Nocardioides sp.]